MFPPVQSFEEQERNLCYTYPARKHGAAQANQLSSWLQTNQSMTENISIKITCRKYGFKVSISDIVRVQSDFSMLFFELNCPANCRENLVLLCLVHSNDRGTGLLDHPFNATLTPCDDGDMAFVAWLCKDQSHPASPGGMSNENYTNIAWFRYLLEIYSISTEIILKSKYTVI